MDWVEQVKLLGPCSPALGWLIQMPDPQTAWERCANPAWMFWALSAYYREVGDETGVPFARLCKKEVLRLVHGRAVHWVQKQPDSMLALYKATRFIGRAVDKADLLAQLCCIIQPNMASSLAVDLVTNQASHECKQRMCDRIRQVFPLVPWPWPWPESW